MSFIKTEEGKWSKSSLFILGSWFFISLLAPVYFMADDWEHLNWYHQNLPNFNLLNEVFRVPSWVVLHRLIFPIFAEKQFFLGKLISYAFLFSASYLFLLSFFPKAKEQWHKSLLFPVIVLAMAFPANMFEWNFWPTNMTCFPALFMMAFSFKKSIENPDSWGWVIAKFFSYLFGFYAYESLLPMAILLEAASELYIRDSKNGWVATWTVFKRVLIFIILALSSKYILDQMHSFEYPAKFGFKPHLFQQYLVMLFSHDYYKTRHLTGALSLISFLSFAYYRFRYQRRDFLHKDLFLLAAFFVGSSYYWMIMDYSARRALGGQIYFFNGLVMLFLLSKLLTFRSLKKGEKFFISLFIIVTSIHHIYILSQKFREKSVIEVNSANLIKMVKNANEPLSISLSQPRENIGRAWNFVWTRHLNGYLRHYVPKEYWKNLKFSYRGDPFEEKLDKTPYLTPGKRRFFSY